MVYAMKIGITTTNLTKPGWKKQMYGTKQHTTKNQWVIERIKEEIKKNTLRQMKIETKYFKIHGNAAKAVLRREFIA